MAKKHPNFFRIITRDIDGSKPLYSITNASISRSTTLNVIRKQYAYDEQNQNINL